MGENMKYRKLTGILILVGSVIGTALPLQVSAVTPYDSVVETVSSLELSRNGTTQGSPACNPLDITNTWLSIMNDDSAWWSGTQYIGGATRENTQAAFQEALDNGTGWAVSALKYSNSSVTGTGDDPIGHAVRVVFSPSSTSYVDFATYYNQQYVAMRNTDGEPVYAVIIQLHDPDGNSIPGNDCTPMVTQSIADPGTGSVFLENRGIAARPTDDAYEAEPLYVNAPVTYPNTPGVYEGELMTAMDVGVDSDGDGLDAEVELRQGTVDSNIDTDGDGLSDLIESQWYGSRDDVFCGTSQCAYPDPLVKDVYIETDWMDDGTTELKPSSTQIGLVESAFAAKNINLHIDTGQYGGGNELPSYEENLFFMPTVGEADLYDFKNGTSTNPANFSINRKDIWRYLIAGDKRDAANSGKSGAALAGDDDIFIALGNVVDTHPLTQDQAVAGTMIHEIGHSLCLSNDAAYLGQDSSCVFASIDTAASSDYDSAMNYNKQFSLVNYSNGANGTNDHDDWSAVGIGIDDFIGKADETESSMLGSRRYIQQPED